jgi:hypothetical protein
VIVIPLAESGAEFNKLFFFFWLGALMGLISWE